MGQFMIFAEIISRMQERGVEFVIIGGTAVNIQGYVRFTNDLDLILKMDSRNLLNAVETLLEAGFTTRLPVDPRGIADEETRKDWMENKNMKALSFRRDEIKVDLVFAAPLDYSDLHIENKKAGRFMYPVPSKEDLIRLKEGTGREQDEADIRRLRILIDATLEQKES
jgi:hypothetical protein